MAEEMHNERGPRRFMSKTASAMRFMDDDEIDAKIDQYANEDKSSTKTLTRSFVERYLQNKSWYFPGHSLPNGPSLSKAYAYYEHFTLARHFSQAAADHRLERAEPGEQEDTELYSPIWTPETQLIEFGIGVALYFSTLRVLAVILIIAGLIQLPNVLYYAGSVYSNWQPGLRAATLKGTAICTLGEWVVCTTCAWTQFDSFEERDRFANSTDPVTGETTTLVLRNACDRPGITQGIVNYSGLIFLFACFLLFGLYQRKRERLFDESKQTATDYSVVVNNPPPNAYDCDEWRDFFAQFADKEVVGVTIALDNHELLRKLLNRRIYRSKLKAILPRNFDLDDEDLVREEASRILKEQEGERKGILECLYGCTTLPLLRLMDIALPPDVLADRIFRLTDEIKEHLTEEYSVTKVFVTFETEAGQRTCLEAMSTSKMIIGMNQTERVPPSAVFHGTVLSVDECAEPNTIRWLDLHVGTMKKFTQRVITLIITLGIVAAAGWLVYLCRLSLGAEYSGPLTTVFNSIIPIVVKLLLYLENHGNEGSRQESLYIKITIFRWVNTAILTKLITPFTSTVGNGTRDVLTTIHSILWSELLLSPFLKLIDVFGNIEKHVIGPRMRTQESMNSYFQGTVYNLGERYTDMTKILFLCFFYSALFPSCFFFGGAILLVQYYSDKYCLMRIWQSAPFLGPKLAIFSRRYFFSGALLAYVISAGYDWAQFPFDNLCDPEDANSTFAGTYWDVVYLDPALNAEGPTFITVTQPTNVISCNQDWRANEGFFFPPTANRLQSADREWMTDQQETVANLFGWSSLVLLIIFVVTFFGRSILNFFASFIRATYKAGRVDAQIDFENVAEISMYVPQFKVGALNYPVLACDVDEVNTRWIGWSDPSDPSYDKHNLIFDVPYENMKRQKRETAKRSASGGNDVNSSHREASPIFSIVKSWSRSQDSAKLQEEAGVVVA